MTFTLLDFEDYDWERRADGMYRLLNTFTARWDGHDGNEYRLTFKRGLVWDGASVPKIFQWYLPNIDRENKAYTLAGLAHDALYGSELLPKDAADDLFRGTMRDAGIPRRKASFAEFLVEHFAGRHYGKKADRWGIRLHVTMERRAL